MEAQNIIFDLQQRGLVAQCTDLERLTSLVKNEKITLYCGFDPTAESLTVGNLLALITLKRFANAGHRVIVLIGNLTGMIGDPSGRSADRPVLSEQQVHMNAHHIAIQSANIVGLEFNIHDPSIVFNANFYEHMNVLQFMREIGIKFSVNKMLTKDSIDSRLNSGGLTFAEMSYSLFQAADFNFLAQRNDCKLQIGGNDQWGNICSGVELARTNGKEVFGLTFPLVTKKDGTKFGKSSDGAVWLDPKKTTPWDFYQFWINLSDEEAEKIISMFSLQNNANFLATLKENKEHLPKRHLQNILALEMTVLVHGTVIGMKCERIAKAMFQGEWTGLSREELEQANEVINGEEVTLPERTDGKFDVVGALIHTGLATSKTDARKLIDSKGININGFTVTDHVIEKSKFNPYHGEFVVLRKGNKHIRIIKQVSPVLAS